MNCGNKTPNSVLRNYSNINLLRRVRAALGYYNYIPGSRKLLDKNRPGFALSVVAYKDLVRSHLQLLSVAGEIGKTALASFKSILVGDKKGPDRHSPPHSHWETFPFARPTLVLRRNGRVAINQDDSVRDIFVSWLLVQY